ncbi:MULTISPECIES: hypothetical protein [Vibrio]|uniref:hypothetical protein n=1 Tax=Vibrio TaxID=662 RepID=UPI0001B943CB|nr:MULTISPECIES: hypothetical protein [Vibrio]EEX34580.1 calcium binding hemolysin protein putative [Vibrio coralliilyticus ATCC BAA-450]MDE3898624.1 hypothetical protein [Vibrio sp. CC007]
MNTISNTIPALRQEPPQQNVSEQSDHDRNVNSSNQVSYGNISDSSITSDTSITANSEGSSSESASGSSGPGFFKNMAQGLMKMVSFAIQACIKLAPVAVAGASAVAMVDPLVVDKDGDREITTTKMDKKFDANGDGKLETVAGVGEGDAIPAFDANGNGVAGEDGKELLGNYSDVDGDGKPDGYGNGFEALEALAEEGSPGSTADGVLDQSELKEIHENTGLVLMNADGTVADNTVNSVNLGYTTDQSFTDENGNVHSEIGEGIVIDGEQRAMHDVNFQTMS